MSGLRIALVAPPYFDVPPAGYGGVEAVVADLADTLVDRGHSVTLIGAGRDGTRARFVSLWDEPPTERLGEPFPEVVHAAATRPVIAALAAGEGLDIVHDHTLAGPLLAPYYRSLGVPTVITTHGPLTGDLHRYYSMLSDQVSLVAISERQRALAPDLNWVGTVHNAVRAETFPFRRDKEEYALWLGRYNPEKGPDLALEAAHAAGVPLVLAGKCNERAEKEYFEQEIRPRLTENDTVFGVANAAEKRKLLAGARCLLFPIQWEEPFGMVMIEAMACGTPVVALRGGSVPEIVKHGITGLICDHPDQLPKAIIDADEINPQTCRSHVIEHFGTDRLGAGYEAAYDHAIRKVYNEMAKISI
jgi:glycosyltransferase involved in cell wall biosynthesis